MSRLIATTALVVTALICSGCHGAPAGPTGRYGPGTPIAFPTPAYPASGAYTLVIDTAESCGIPAPLNRRTYDVQVGEPTNPGWAVINREDGSLGGEVWTSGRLEWNNFDIGGCDYPDPATDPHFYICGDGYVLPNDTGFSGEITGQAWVGTPGTQNSCSRDARHRVTLTPRR